MKTDIDKLRETFVRYLTVDIAIKEKGEFNQALFDPEHGLPYWNRIALDHVMDRFEKAVKEVSEK